MVKVDLSFQPTSVFPFFPFLPLSLAVLVKITCILEEALGIKPAKFQKRDAKIKEFWMNVKKNLNFFTCGLFCYFFYFAISLKQLNMTCNYLHLC